MKKASHIYESLGVSAAILIFCVAAVIYGVVPMVQKISDNASQLTSLSKDYTDLQKKLALLTSLDEVTLRDQLVNALAAIPADPSIPTIFSTVEALAGESGVTISDMETAGGTVATSSAVKLTPAEKQLGTQVIPFNVTVTGSFDGIIQFISKAPMIRRLLRIRTFSITIPKDKPDMSVTLAMDAFYQTFPTTLGLASSPIESLTASEENVMQQIDALTLVTDQSTVVLPPPQIGKVKQDPFNNLLQPIPVSIPVLPTTAQTIVPPTTLLESSQSATPSGL